MLRITSLFTLLLVSVWCHAQEGCIELAEGSANRVAEHILYLASDDLEGREPGTDGAILASRYIFERFEEYGLEPVMDGVYYQPFEITTRIRFPEVPENRLVYRKKSYTIPADYFPLAYSVGSGRVKGETIDLGYGISASEKEWDDYAEQDPKELKGKIFVMDISSPDGIHPHSEYLKYHDLGVRVDQAAEYGAAGVIFVNLGEGANDPNAEYRKLKSRHIPVVFVQNRDLAKKLKKGKEVEISVLLEEEKITARNVMGYVNNDASHTIIIGAHYDHLGYGGSSSLYRGGEPEIHNGADDNASGTAGLLELAYNLSQRKSEFTDHNYLFIAFSGEEMGLLGSSYYVKNQAIPRENVACMLNMDMIGRLEENRLAVSGVGTSPIWEDVLLNGKCGNVQLKTSESGIGPSDHTSFYYQEIPVLHFFTGTHSDYHKPTDDFEKINIDGEVQVLSLIINVINRLGESGPPDFTPTKEETMAAPRFTVTLGVMPDYMFEGSGMRIDGVTEGKPASKAGMQAGDVVIRMGEFKVEDMMSYMRALGSFKKGDKTEVTFKRGEEERTATVQF